MALSKFVHKFTQCVVPCLALHLVAACDSHTVTLSRYVRSEVDTGGMHVFAVAPEGGAVSRDIAHLLRNNLQEGSAFESLLWPSGVTSEHTPAPSPERQSAIMWARANSADALIVPHLNLGAPKPCQNFTDPKATEPRDDSTDHLCITITGTISIIETETARPILFEPVEHVFTWPKDDPADADTHSLQALQDFVQQFCDRLVPHEQKASMTLFSSPSIQQSEQAIMALIRGDVDEAIGLYRTAIACMPKTSTPKWMRARAHYNLGATLAYAGQREEGLQHLRRAFDLTPDWFFEQHMRDIEAKALSSTKPAVSSHRLWHCRRQRDGSPSCTPSSDP